MSKKEMKLESPQMVTSHDIHIDTEYAEWIAEVKHRYRSAQVKAAVKVNAEKLLWNWQMGRDLVQKKAEERWGGWNSRTGKPGFEARVPRQQQFLSKKSVVYETVVFVLHREHGKTETTCFRNTTV